jgi:hypothetical protein
VEILCAAEAATGSTGGVARIIIGGSFIPSGEREHTENAPPAALLFPAAVDLLGEPFDVLAGVLRAPEQREAPDLYG